MSLELQGLRKSFGGLPVIDGIDLEIPDGGVTTLLGPSGCGKTTLLRILAGLIDADAGDVRGFIPGDATILFQEPRLLPWETVAGNVEFVLPADWSAADRRVAVEAALADVQMVEFAS